MDLFDLWVARLTFPNKLLEIQLVLYLSALAAATSVAAFGRGTHPPQQLVLIKSSFPVCRHT